MGWKTEESEFNIEQGQEVILYSTAPRLVLGSTRSAVQWVPVALSLRVR
jgi:hypothetical protein